MVPAYVVVTLPRRPGERSARAASAPPRDTNIERLLTQYEARRLPAPETGDSTGPVFVTYEVPDMARATALAAALRDMKLDAFPKPGEELP
jgi:hypothetical protein